eukprot:525551-Pelagomonas_calceolata.AAC.2
MGLESCNNSEAGSLYSSVKHGSRQCPQQPSSSHRSSSSSSSSSNHSSSIEVAHWRQQQFHKMHCGKTCLPCIIAAPATQSAAALALQYRAVGVDVAWKQVGRLHTVCDSLSAHVATLIPACTVKRVISLEGLQGVGLQPENLADRLL